MIPAFVSQSPEASRPEHLYRPHPGEVFKRRCLSKTELTQKEVAEKMGISPKHLSRFINGHVQVEITLARKLESVTNISAGAWLHYQTAYDLYKTANMNLEKKPIYRFG
ncbi:HigA family addiction module antitoxin [Aliiglaciecola sp. CAU 1673]|uniref:HigA family addiction module antitoxin n=1 Tax=Aliiglaciecola sp. CAU 1673 TaxID=3032595 RepID=UPI0023DAE554|nr:HigA family addiction module antitoxin [Aliiglaciecola sp. CAU 1673]MDF2179171.1 HigA family addiction module antitoxin [Aliiglaciecola sp. CAU 1673]